MHTCLQLTVFLKKPPSKLTDSVPFQLILSREKNRSCLKFMKSKQMQNRTSILISVTSSAILTFLRPQSENFG